MNELIDKLLELEKSMVDKICCMKNQRYVEAVIEARKKIGDAVTLIARANK